MNRKHLTPLFAITLLLSSLATKAFSALPLEEIEKRNKDAVHFIISVDKVVAEPNERGVGADGTVFLYTCHISGKVLEVINNGSPENTGIEQFNRIKKLGMAGEELKFNVGNTTEIDVDCTDPPNSSFTMVFRKSKLENAKKVELFGHINYNKVFNDGKPLPKIMNGIPSSAMKLNGEFSAFDGKIIE